MYRRTRWGFTFLALFLAGCIWMLSRVEVPLGIDLRGGTELVYGLDLRHLDEDPREVAGRIKDIIARRLNARGLKELSLAVEGEDRLVVQLPGSDDESVEQLKTQVEKTGSLRFQIVAQSQEATRNIERWKNAEARYLRDLRTWASDMRAWREKKEADPAYSEPAPEKPRAPRYVVRMMEERDANGNVVATTPMVLENTPDSYVEGRYIGRVYPTTDENLQLAIGFEMQGEGASLLGELTGKNVGRPMAIVLDDVVTSAPEIKSRITTSGQISGKFTPEEVQNLLTILGGGSLDAKPILRSETKVGPSLGQESIGKGVQAVLFGLVGVMIFIAFYYLAAGLVTNFALVFNIVVVLTFVATFRQDLTLPGIAGILLTIGMAVDANIIIFERVREERNRGKALRQALATGYQKAFSVIFDSNLTTLITGLVLFNFGTGPVKGFAVTLIAGIVVSFVSSLFITRLFLSAALNLNLLKKLRMSRAFRTPRVPFVAYQRPFLYGSAVVIVATWTLVVGRGWENYGIDFTGGARIVMNLKRELTRAELEDEVADLARQYPDLFRDWSLQTLGQTDARGRARQFVLLTRAGGEGNTAEAMPAQDDPAGGAEEEAAGGGAGEGAETAQGAPGEGDASGGGTGAGVPEPTSPVLLSDTPGGPPPEEAQQVQRILEEMLAEKGLLLPPAFPKAPEWVPEEGGDGESMVLEVNLEGVRPSMTDTWFVEALDAHLQQVTGPRGTSLFEGISVEGVELVERAEGEPGITRYRLRLSPYEVPLPGALGEKPTREQAFAAVRRFFQEPPSLDDTGKPFQLSQPFPQVATVGPRVASDLQEQAVVAIFISILGIIFYISLRFEFIFGVAAIMALVHDVMVTIGIMAVTDHFLGRTIPIKINLPELAALLTIIGYSINDTIVIFDRVRENLKTYAKKKLSLRDCIDMSINQTLSRTVLTSLTTLVTVLALLIFGGEALRGFAYTFAVGLVAGTYSTIFVASPILILLHDRARARREAEVQMAA